MDAICNIPFTGILALEPNAIVPFGLSIILMFNIDITVSSKSQYLTMCRDVSKLHHHGSGVATRCGAPYPRQSGSQAAYHVVTLPGIKCNCDDISTTLDILALCRMHPSRI